MNNCLFCKLAKGDIPNYTIYEDSKTLSFLDINPHSKGHTIVIPKVHAETLFDFDDELSKDLIPSIKKTMERIEHVLHPDGFNVGWNHGEVGGQVISHLHVHIMPRWEGDGGGSQHSIINNPGDLSVEEISKLFN